MFLRSRSTASQWYEMFVFFGCFSGSMYLKQPNV